MTDKEQSDTEPVAWRWKWPDSGLWFATENKLYADHVKNHGVAIEPLFTAALAQFDVEPVACAIANRSSELGLDADGRVALHGICQEELERAAPQSDAELGRGDFAKYAEQINKEALARALAEPIPRSPAAQKLMNDTLGFEDEMELITKIRNYEAPPRPEDRPLGFRTNDVPDPYAEGPQSDAEPGGPADYIPIGGAGNGA